MTDCIAEYVKIYINFLRFPFDIKSVPVVFHRVMESIIESLEGTRIYIVDLVI